MADPACYSAESGHEKDFKPSLTESHSEHLKKNIREIWAVAVGILLWNMEVLQTKQE